MQRKGSSAASKAEQNIDTELNLAPIMSVLVILIPVILLTFNFFEVKVQALTAPKMAPARATAEKPVRITLFIERDQARISASSLDSPILVPARPDGTPDYAVIARHMTALRATHPREREVFVGAAPEVHWQLLAGAIDVVRGPATEAGGKAAKGASPLFGEVVLVTE